MYFHQRHRTKKGKGSRNSHDLGFSLWFPSLQENSGLNEWLSSLAPRSSKDIHISQYRLPLGSHQQNYNAFWGLKDINYNQFIDLTAGKRHAVALISSAIESTNSARYGDWGLTEIWDEKQWARLLVRLLQTTSTKTTTSSPPYHTHDISSIQGIPWGGIHAGIFLSIFSFLAMFFNLLHIIACACTVRSGSPKVQFCNVLFVPDARFFIL